MTRLTITISDERHQALKEAAARRGKTIGEIVEQSLESYGIKTTESAARIVAEARRRAGLSESTATAVAAEETRAERNR